MGIITSVNPSTEEVFGELVETDFKDIEKLVKKAKKDKTLADLDVEKRAEIISRIPDLLEKNKERIALVMAKEIGKPVKAGRHEIEISIKRAEAFCKQIPSFLQEEAIFEDENEKNVIRYEPLGVAAVISPWNAPIFVSLAGIIPQLLCGNNVLWKPSEYSSFTGLEIGRLFDELKLLGLPDAAFNIILGGKETGKKLVESDIDIVSLTGSPRAGQDIVRSSADKLHKFVLELGGKDPAIILEDADLDKASREIVKTATMYSGQVCFGVERAYVDEKVYDKFIEKCTEEIKKLKIGNPLNDETDLGPISVKFQFKKILSQIEEAKLKGAKIVYGAERLGHTGYFISPGIVVNVNHSMQIMKEETFGPIIPIMPFKTIEEAISFANDSMYGLTASIWTRDIKRGEEIAKKIEAGTVEINRHGMSKAGLPWGGYKMSGIGRIYSKEGIHNFCNIKHLWIIKR